MPTFSLWNDVCFHVAKLQRSICICIACMKQMLCRSSNTRTFQPNDSGITKKWLSCNALSNAVTTLVFCMYHTTAMSHKMVTLSFTVITVIPHLYHTTAMPVTQQCALSVGVTPCCRSTQNYCHTHVSFILL